MVMIRFDNRRRLTITEKEVEEAFEKYSPKNADKTEDDDEPP